MMPFETANDNLPETGPDMDQAAALFLRAAQGGVALKETAAKNMNFRVIQVDSGCPSERAYQTIELIT